MLPTKASFEDVRRLLEVGVGMRGINYFFFPSPFSLIFIYLYGGKVLGFGHHYNLYLFILYYTSIYIYMWFTFASDYLAEILWACSGPECHFFLSSLSLCLA